MKKLIAASIIVFGALAYFVPGIATFADAKTVQICHVSQGDGAVNVEWIEPSAVSNHLQHGDYYTINGSCNKTTTTPSAPVLPEPEDKVKREPDEKVYRGTQLCHVGQGDGSISMEWVESSALLNHIAHGDFYPLFGVCEVKHEEVEDNVVIIKKVYRDVDYYVFDNDYYDNDVSLNIINLGDDDDFWNSDWDNDFFVNNDVTNNRYNDRNNDFYLADNDYFDNDVSINIINDDDDDWDDYNWNNNDWNDYDWNKNSRNEKDYWDKDRNDNDYYDYDVIGNSVNYDIIDYDQDYQSNNIIDGDGNLFGNGNVVGNGNIVGNNNSIVN